MKNNAFWFIVCYCIYLIFAILNPSIVVSGIPIRHFITLIMIVFCVKYRPQKWDWFVVLYSLYIFCYFSAGYITGYTSEHISFILTTLLVALVLYRSTMIMVMQFDKLELITMLLLVVFVIDAIFTVGQYYRIPQFLMLPQLMGLELNDYYMQRLEGAYSMEGQVLFGIVGAVANGYMLSAASILAWKKYGNKSVIYNVLLWGLFMLASFYSQERAGFYLATLFSVFLFLLSFWRQKGISRVFIAILIIMLIFSAESIYDYINSYGRYADKGLDDGGRFGYFDEAIAFISENPWGGHLKYANTHSRMPHNLFANAFVSGGLLGGVVIIIINIIQIYKIFMFSIKKSLKNRDVLWLPFLYCLIYLDYLIQSVAHNQSIVYGTPLFFVFWGICSSYVNGSNRSIYAKMKMLKFLKQ